MDIVRLEDLTKEYRLGTVVVPALQGVNLSLREGDFIAVMGPSGSGKSTLLNILGCLDRPTSGLYYLAEREVSTLNDDERADLRSRRVGFIFQSYNLIAQLTVLENIELPLFYQRCPAHESLLRAQSLAQTVGLSDRLGHRPSELSGGQQQRVAIARALANDPAIILADEPTGNLDSATGREILDMLDDLNARGKTIVLITHDEHIASHARRRIYMQDGRMTEN